MAGVSGNLEIAGIVAEAASRVTTAHWQSPQTRTDKVARQAYCWISSRKGVSVMPWYAWLIIILALGSIVGSLLLLRDSATRLPLDAEQLKRIKARNLEQEASDKLDN
jgi:hypothetical protein